MPTTLANGARFESAYAQLHIAVARHVDLRKLATEHVQRRVMWRVLRAIYHEQIDVHRHAAIVVHDAHIDVSDALDASTRTGRHQRAAPTQIAVKCLRAAEDKANTLPNARYEWWRRRARRLQWHRWRRW